MDNSFKPQGEFQPQGNFQAQGEFNAPEQPRQFVSAEPAVAVNLPYVKKSKVALLFSILGILALVASFMFYVPDLLSKFLTNVSIDTVLYLVLGLCGIGVVFQIVAIVLSTSGIKAKYGPAVAALTLGIIFLIVSVLAFFFNLVAFSLILALVGIAVSI